MNTNQFKEMIKQMQMSGKIYLTKEGKALVKEMGASWYEEDQKCSVQSVRSIRGAAAGTY
ncbi:hypothetical protein A33I_14010 [Alkalihalophilus marmarensis DSM 21297]|uniref:Uncharacterized protein n=1 Tax=Alkalihalophilus marmarensis DSM 21297 TaxID=1188261 RepID=U6SN44_9BACI|nr:hypothetical protein A33I_14010 [Alkalihalophilus marmarensis DSM 21297]